jgi:hypothetical protein
LASQGETAHIARQLVKFRKALADKKSPASGPVAKEESSESKPAAVAAEKPAEANSATAAVDSKPEPLPPQRLEPPPPPLPE